MHNDKNLGAGNAPAQPRKATPSEAAREDAQRFDRIWDALESVALCDTRGGAEYRRVEWEWQQARRPARVAAFIEARANVGPFAPDFNPSDYR